jgi:hypothetical protein
MKSTFQNFLLIDRGGIAAFYLAGLRSKGKINKASYFVDTINVWNPASKLEDSLMSTSTEFYIEKYDAIESFTGDLKTFKAFCFSTFHHWYIDKKRKDQTNYQKTVDLSIKDYFLIEEETENPEQQIITKEDTMSQTIRYDLIHDYIFHHATEREQWFYLTMLSIIKIKYSENYYYILNYPGKELVTRKTVENHKNIFKAKLRRLAAGEEVKANE